MPYPLVSQPTKIIFWSGDEAYKLSEVPVKYQGKNYVRLYLQLEDYVKRRYGITDRMLDFTLGEPQGVYKTMYPKSFFHPISFNPEMPITVTPGLNFDGTEVIDDEISALKNEVQRKDNIISSLQGEVDTLQKEAKKLAEQVRMLRRKAQEI